MLNSSNSKSNSKNSKKLENLPVELLEALELSLSDINSLRSCSKTLKLKLERIRRKLLADYRVYLIMIYCDGFYRDSYFRVCKSPQPPEEIAKIFVQRMGNSQVRVQEFSITFTRKRRVNLKIDKEISENLLRHEKLRYSHLKLFSFLTINGCGPVVRRENRRLEPSEGVRQLYCGKRENVWIVEFRRW